MGLDWDTPLPDREAERWNQFQGEQPLLAAIRVPRSLGAGTPKGSLTLHEFSDASERAYAAVLYLQTINQDGKAVVSLITVKSKVAPVKRVTLPRLKLNAATLLARLTHHTVEVLNLAGTPIYLWTDSMVTLGWIQGHASRWKTYVVNRVAEIQNLVPDTCWSHLPGSLNSADCASRGLLPSELVRFSLWWDGPEFLRRGQPHQTDPVVAPSDCLDEERALSTAATTSPKPEEPEMLTRFSSLSRLLRG
jgi:hypothetical protein